jgi:hypothetical protein
MLWHDHVRLAACLAHTVPGVTVELVCSNDERLIVAHHRLDAHFSPCELRTALLADDQPGLPRFVDVVVDATITAGLQHLGGGLYERYCDLHTERWFATLLDHEQLGDVLGANQFDLPNHAVDVRLLPDRELGVTAVRVICDGAFVGRIDEVASWALAACMVAELIIEVDPTQHSNNPTNTRNHP